MQNDFASLMQNLAPDLAAEMFQRALVLYGRDSRVKGQRLNGLQHGTVHPGRNGMGES